MTLRVIGSYPGGQDRVWAPAPPVDEGGGFVRREINKSGAPIGTGTYLWHSSACEQHAPGTGPVLLPRMLFGVWSGGVLVEEGPQMALTGPVGPLDAFVTLWVVRTPGGRVTIEVQDLDSGQSWARSSPTSQDVVTFNKRNLSLGAGQTFRFALRITDGVDLLRVNRWELELVPK